MRRKSGHAKGASGSVFSSFTNPSGSVHKTKSISESFHYMSSCHIRKDGFTHRADVTNRHSRNHTSSIRACLHAPLSLRCPAPALVRFVRFSQSLRRILDVFLAAGWLYSSIALGSRSGGWMRVSAWRKWAGHLPKQVSKSEEEEKEERRRRKLPKSSASRLLPARAVHTWKPGSVLIRQYWWLLDNSCSFHVNVDLESEVASPLRCSLGYLDILPRAPRGWQLVARCPGRRRITGWDTTTGKCLCILRSWLDSGYTPMGQSMGTWDCISHLSYVKVHLDFSSTSTCPLHSAVTCPVSWSPEEYEMLDFYGRWLQWIHAHASVYGSFRLNYTHFQLEDGLGHVLLASGSHLSVPVA